MYSFGVSPPPPQRKIVGAPKLYTHILSSCIRFVHTVTLHH
jgi:hypothetical protein